MNPHTHFLFPFFISVILVKLNILSWELAVVCGVIGVLVDIDHYVEYILHSKTNRFSLKACWNNSIRFHRFNQRSFVHEWFGALVLTLIFLVILFFSWKTSLILAIAYYSHLFLDYLHLKRERFVRGRLGRIFVKETYLEFYIDVVLVVWLIVLIFI